MEETGWFGENQRPISSHWQTVSHNVVHLALIEIRILDYELMPIRTIDIINSQGYLSYINDKICFNRGSETLRGINMENETCYLLLISGPSTCPWLHDSWIYNYLCNQCPSPLILWIRISIRASCTTLCDKVCQRLATGRCFCLGPLVSSIIKTDSHDITAELLLKAALNTIK